MRASRPFVTIVVPCRNEARYIAHCLESILANDYPQDRLEVLVVDGRSDDRTREIVASYAARHGTIRLVDNPKRITPAALNAGIGAARGDIIMRMDAHVLYPVTYIGTLVTALEETGADGVGGPIATLPADDTPTARAIALALSHPFGVGNSQFRTGVTERRWTDAVAFGCYRRTVFDRFGRFDEELVRNQDDEFDLRLVKQGGRLLLVPDAISGYYARATLGQVGRMFYQYGYFKPLVARKLGRVMTGRQLVPSLFLLVLGGTALLSPWLPVAGAACVAIAAAYTTLVVGCALAALPRHGFRCALALAAAFPTLHAGYGAGFLLGIGDHLLGLRRPRAAVPLTR